MFFMLSDESQEGGSSNKNLNSGLICSCAHSHTRAAILSTLKIGFYTLSRSFSVLANDCYSILLNLPEILENLPKAIISK